MARFGLVGPAYRSQSLNADAETCKNWYCEKIEKQGKSQFALYPTAGTKLFCTLGDRPVRALITTQGTGALAKRTFAIGGSGFNEILANGTVIPRGLPIIDDELPVSNAPGPSQILFASGGTPYVYDLVANTVTPLAPGVLASISQVGYSDGFFIALFKNSNKIAVSKTLDATIWDPTEVANVSVFPDNITSLLVDHRELFMWGGSKSVVYFDSGNLFPFDPNPSGIIEQGIIAPNSPVKADNSVFWLAGSERGAGIFYRTVGYTPQRVSDHGVEYAISQYPTITDAVGYAFEDQGHTFIQWLFPSANRSWVLDVELGFWHERTFWNRDAARHEAHHSWVHTYNFGKHLVGDPFSGNVYEQSINFLDDAGNSIRRERVAPHISKEKEWLFYPAIEIDLETGLGPQPPLLQGGAYDSTRVQSVNGDGTKKYTYDVGVSVAGRGYTTTVLVQNNGLQPVFVGTQFSGAMAIAPGTIVQINQFGTGDGVAHITLDIYTTNVADLLDLVMVNPIILDMVTLTNLIPLANRTFVGWTPQGAPTPATITLTQAQPTPGSKPREPQLMLSWSDDGGHTYSNEYTLDCGMAGQFKRRAIKRRLGKSRGRTFKIAATDPVPWRINGAYIPPAVERVDELNRKVT